MSKTKCCDNAFTFAGAVGLIAGSVQLHRADRSRARRHSGALERLTGERATNRVSAGSGRRFRRGLESAGAGHGSGPTNPDEILKTKQITYRGTPFRASPRPPLAITDRQYAGGWLSNVFSKSTDFHGLEQGEERVGPFQSSGARAHRWLARWQSESNASFRRVHAVCPLGGTGLLLRTRPRNLSSPRCGLQLFCMWSYLEYHPLDFCLSPLDRSIERKM